MRPLLFFALLTFTFTLHAADPKPTPAPDLQQMMEAWAKLNQPGQPHAEFKKSVGAWKVAETHYLGPKPVTGTGSSTFTTILGGRYLMQEYKSRSPMGNFEGLGIVAYDNLKKKYVSAWMDNMSTGIMVSTGTKNGKVITFSSRETGPDGKPASMRMVQREVNDNQIIFTMSHKPAGEKKFQKTMEIVYTRAK